jgi:hypothetical protein
MKNTIRLGATLIVALAVMLGLTASNGDATFFQCPPVGDCIGSTLSDFINGTPDLNYISGLEGDDSIFAGDNPIGGPCKNLDKETVDAIIFVLPKCFALSPLELIMGGPGNDFISGGPGSDELQGEDGNDILLPGSDGIDFGQYVYGGPDNDTVFVFAGDTNNCLFIYGDPGQDVVNLVGFGPHTAVMPFEIGEQTISFLHVVDPITSGDVYIAVTSNGDLGTEVINGLISPNPTFVVSPNPEGCKIRG